MANPNIKKIEDLTEEEEKSGNWVLLPRKMRQAMRSKERKQEKKLRRSGPAAPGVKEITDKDTK